MILKTRNLPEGWSCDGNTQELRAPDGRTYDMTTGLPLARKYTETWSLLSIVKKDGNTVSRNLKATPKMLKHLLQDAQETGFLYIFDDQTSEAIRIEDIHSISMTKITTD